MNRDFKNRFIDLIQRGKHKKEKKKRKKRQNIPPDKLVEDIDILLQLVDFYGLFGVDDRERALSWRVIDVAASRLEEAADEEDLEERICIFEEFERGTGANELSGKIIKVAFGDGFEVFVDLIAEDYTKTKKRKIGRVQS